MQLQGILEAAGAHIASCGGVAHHGLMCKGVGATAAQGAHACILLACVIRTPVPQACSHVCAVKGAMGLMNLEALTQPLPHVRRRAGRPAKRKSALEVQPEDGDAAANQKNKKVRSLQCMPVRIMHTGGERCGAVRRGAAPSRDYFVRGTARWRARLQWRSAK